MHIRRSFLTAIAAILIPAFAVPAAAQSRQPIKLVASFSILGDMVQRIGGKHVQVTTLVGANGDTHVYRPTPAAARAVSEADLLVVNGLKFEGWLERLIDASDFRGTQIVATEGIAPMSYDAADQEHAEHDAHGHEEHGRAEHDEHGHDEHGHEEHARAEHDEHRHEEDGHADHHDHGVFDPHAWQSLSNAVIYVDNITAALAKIDPKNAGVFYRNRRAYLAELQALDAEIRKSFARLPESSRTIVTSHDAFRYFGRDYGLNFVAPQGLSTESEASAQDVVRLIRQIRAQRIRAVFVENVADPRLMQRIADETNAAIGGTLYPGALSGPNGPAPTYLDMMRHNASTLAEALAP